MAVVRRGGGGSALAGPAGRAALALVALSAAGLAWPASVAAQVQVQLSCSGTVFETSGRAERRQAVAALRLSLALEAEAPTAAGALAELQRRLARVRDALRQLQVQELQVGSPSTWQRSVQPGGSGGQAATITVANLQLSGRLAPQRLQALVTTVGTLPGVRLSPVATEAKVDPAAAAADRRALLEQAYGQAEAEARQLAAVLGRSKLTPLEVQLEGAEPRPIALRAMAAEAAPFDPAELPKPLERLGLRVRYCAH